jgi:carbon storage regulator
VGLCLEVPIGDSIYINGNIKVTVWKKPSGKVMLDIDAPKDIPVHREKIQRKINEEASKVSR